MRKANKKFWLKICIVHAATATTTTTIRRCGDCVNFWLKTATTTGSRQTAIVACNQRGRPTEPHNNNELRVLTKERTCILISMQIIGPIFRGVQRVKNQLKIEKIEKNPSNIRNCWNAFVSNCCARAFPILLNVMNVCVCASVRCLLFIFYCIRNTTRACCSHTQLQEALGGRQRVYLQRKSVFSQR